MRTYDFVDPGKKKLCFFAKPGLSEFRAVSAQKERFGLQYKGSRLKNKRKKENFKPHV